MSWHVETLLPEARGRSVPALAGEPWTQRLVRRWQSLTVWLELTRNLAARDVETRYKHSVLGLYWALINPLVTAATYAFVFGAIFHASSQPVPYVVMLLGGLTFWNLFANALGSATVCVTGNAALLAKLYFPRVVLPTAAVLARLIDFGFSLVVLAIFLALFRVPVHWGALWLAPVLLLELGFTLGLAYLASALNVLYRDVSQIVGLVLMVWVWLSPVMYTLQGVAGWVRAVVLLNPMGAVVEAEKDLLFTGRLSDPITLWGAAAWAAFAFVGGLTVFKRIEPLFAEVM